MGCQHFIHTFDTHDGRIQNGKCSSCGVNLTHDQIVEANRLMAERTALINGLEKENPAAALEQRIGWEIEKKTIERDALLERAEQIDEEIHQLRPVPSKAVPKAKQEQALKVE